MRRTGTVMLMALLFAAPAYAQGWIEPRPGGPVWGVEKVRTQVTVRVVDRIALVEVEEYFRNAGGGLGEGDYLYPLPGEAVFSNVSLFQGDQELRGETMDADRARAIYEEIVRRKRDPALIEWVGRGLIRARVFPIEPGETRRITLRYTQVLERSGDALQFRYVAGGRWRGAPVPLPRLPERPDPRVAVRPEHGGTGAATVGFALIIEDGARFRDAFSPTHEVRTTREGERMTVRPAAAVSGDFAVFLPFANAAIGLSLATHRPSGEDGYFLLTLSPGQVREAGVPRDVTAVVDVSGSMSGGKMEQARRALLQLIGTLGPADRLRLIAFSSGVYTWRPDWTAADAAGVREARAWVEALRADGGTNISGALEEALRAPTDEGRLPFIVFLTDGLPTVGERNAERIGDMVERRLGRWRIFAFGIGYDVNTVLLDRLGAAGRGGAQYVRPDEDIEAAVGALAAKIRHPVLADLAIADAPVRLKEVLPARLPDLFAGEELVILGRYEGSAREGTLAVTGRRGGRAERYATRAAFPAHATENDYIPRLWAARRLGELTRLIRQNGPDRELVDEIRNLALRYGLLTEYTSYLVLEPDAVVAGGGPVPPLPHAPRTEVSGAAAVAASEAARRVRDARSVADLAEVQKQVADAVVGRADSPRRVVGGRAFEQRTGAWVDVRHADRLRLVTVAPFSSAYFALLDRLPELGPVWGELGMATVAGREVSLRVAAGGTERLSAAELDRVVRGFRER